MKPSDFYIGSREFFGAFIPGLIWLVAFTLIFINSSIESMLKYASKQNWIGVLAFVGVALIIGTVLQYPSFGFSRYFSKRKELSDSENRSKLHNLLSGEKNFPQKQIEAAFNEAEKIINKYDLIIDVRHFDKKVQSYVKKRKIFTISKLSVLAQSAELGLLLKQKEAEINFIGSLPLPIFFLAIGLIVHSNNIAGLSTWINSNQILWIVCVVLAGFLAIIFLLIRFTHLRKEESRMCLDYFIYVEKGVITKRETELSDKTSDKN